MAFVGQDDREAQHPGRQADPVVKGSETRNMLTTLTIYLLIGSFLMMAAGWISDLLRLRLPNDRDAYPSRAERLPGDPYEVWAISTTPRWSEEAASFLTSPRRP
jgi:hypothetical protein